MSLAQQMAEVPMAPAIRLLNATQRVASLMGLVHLDLEVNISYSVMKVGVIYWIFSLLYF